MAVRFTRLTPNTAESARRFLSERWPPEWSDEFTWRLFIWRYLTKPDAETLLAFDGDRCVAILDSYLHSYLVGNEIATVRETCNWYCRPEYRPVGVGLRLMRRMMAKPEPIVIVGATEKANSVLGRLNWQRLPDARAYVMPLRLKTTVAFGLRTHLPAGEALARLIPSGLGIFHPRQLAPPMSSAQVMISPELELPAIDSDEYILAPVLDNDRLSWLAQAPKEVGELLRLAFLIDGRLVAISITRLKWLREGLIAKILHVQSIDRSPVTIGWIMSQTALHLADKGAGLIICLASDPIILDALRRAGFLPAGWRRAFWWSADKTAPSGTMNLSKMIGEEIWS
jgi:hypothetical protein